MKKRRWIVQQIKRGIPTNKVASAQRVSRITVWKIKNRYQRDGELSLKDHKPGKLPVSLAPKFYDLVISAWRRNKCGARKLHAILKKQGFSVSLRKISQVMVTEGFQNLV